MKKKVCIARTFWPVHINEKHQKVLSTNTDEYYEHGKIKSQRIVTASSESLFEYHYDDNWKLVKSLHYENGELISSRTEFPESKPISNPKNIVTEPSPLNDNCIRELESLKDENGADMIIITDYDIHAKPISIVIEKGDSFFSHDIFKYEYNAYNDVVLIIAYPYSDGLKHVTEYIYEYY